MESRCPFSTYLWVGFQTGHGPVDDDGLCKVCKLFPSLHPAFKGKNPFNLGLKSISEILFSRQLAVWGSPIIGGTFFTSNYVFPANLADASLMFVKEFGIAIGCNYPDLATRFFSFLFPSRSF